MKKAILGLFTLLFLINSMQSRGEKDESNRVLNRDLITLYNACNLKNCISFDVFEKSYEGYIKYHLQKHIIVVCDFSKPSNENRFYVIDLEQKKVILSTLVAHGKNSGDLYANSFSNEPESHQSCKGFFKIGAQIKSPKNGTALLLEGLEKNINDNALKREIIIHGAKYVSREFIMMHGKLGRSFGCPALPVEEMIKVAPLLANGALLFINDK